MAKDTPDTIISSADAIAASKVSNSIGWIVLIIIMNVKVIASRAITKWARRNSAIAVLILVDLGLVLACLVFLVVLAFFFIQIVYSSIQTKPKIAYI